MEIKLTRLQKEKIKLFAEKEYGETKIRFFSDGRVRAIDSNGDNVFVGCAWDMLQELGNHDAYLMRHTNYITKYITTAKGEKL